MIGGMPSTAIVFDYPAIDNTETVTDKHIINALARADDVRLPAEISLAGSGSIDLTVSIGIYP